MFTSPSSFASLPIYAMPVPGSVTAPRGFRASGVHAGIKRSRRDVGLLVSDTGAVSAACFTQNRAAAAPVLVTRDECHSRAVQGLVVNAGNANACTGEQGWRDALRMRALAAQTLGLPAQQVAVASTGVIGVPLPMGVIERGIERAAARLSDAGGDYFAAAIRTTDRTAKQGALAVEVHGGEVTLGFAAKGAGMISPNMATTLCFVTCDARVPADLWERMLKDAVDASFNRISVDGQASTNDMVLGLANGSSGVRLGDRDLERLDAALRVGLLTMALAVVADGEGATTTVRLRVAGARDHDEARRVARAVADSPLVKTAVYGRDANWGRVVQSAGMVLPGDDTRPLTCDVVFAGVTLLRAGEVVVLDGEQTARLSAALAATELDLSIDLRRGDAADHVYFSDLTHDYVRLNAGLRT